MEGWKSNFFRNKKCKYWPIFPQGKCCVVDAILNSISKIVQHWDYFIWKYVSDFNLQRLSFLNYYRSWRSFGRKVQIYARFYQYFGLHQNWQHPTIEGLGCCLSRKSAQVLDGQYPSYTHQLSSKAFVFVVCCPMCPWIFVFIKHTLSVRSQMIYFFWWQI